MVMKNFVWVLVAGVVLIGCDGKKTAENKQPAFQGVQAKKDHVADAVSYLHQSDIPRAIQSFDQAIKQDPTNAQNYLLLGQVYLRLKNYTRAVDSFGGALKVDPNNGETYYFLAVGKYFQNDLEGARKDIQSSLAIFMNNRDDAKFKQALALYQALNQPQSGSASQNSEKIPAAIQ
jgi:cytochrome c-type biogenesis protein CcmH/NrfG